MIELTGTFQLARPGGTIVSLAPAVGGGFEYGFTSEASYVAPSAGLRLPILFGLPWGPHQIVFSLMAGDATYWVPEGLFQTSVRAVNVVTIGTGVGVAFRVSDGFQLMPAAGVAGEIASIPLGGDSSSPVNGSGVLWQGGLAMLFGR